MTAAANEKAVRTMAFRDALSAGELSVPAAKTLALTQFGQATNYFCGPAAGYMVIRYLHGSSFASRHNGASLSQANLATDSHMRTAVTGSTDWGTGNWVRGVNRWRGSTWYVQVNAPSGSLLTSVATHSIRWNGMPFAADTVELQGGVHYNGHPVNRTIGHWIVAYGYSSSGATTSWADPATTVWSGVNPKFSYTTALFASRFLWTNGIAY